MFGHRAHFLFDEITTPSPPATDNGVPRVVYGGPVLVPNGGPRANGHEKGGPVLVPIGGPHANGHGNGGGSVLVPNVGANGHGNGGGPVRVPNGGANGHGNAGGPVLVPNEGANGHGNGGLIFFPNGGLRANGHGNGFPGARLVLGNNGRGPIRGNANFGRGEALGLAMRGFDLLGYVDEVTAAAAGMHPDEMVPDEALHGMAQDEDLYEDDIPSLGNVSPIVSDSD